MPGIQEDCIFSYVSFYKTIDFIFQDEHSVNLITVQSSIPGTNFIYDG